MITTVNKASAKDLYIDVTGMELLPVTLLADYTANGGSMVFDAGCFPAEETEKMIRQGIAGYNARSDALRAAAQGRACTSCFKKLEDGTVVMGRNMDYPSTFGPAIIFRTKGNGKTTYATAGIGYTPTLAAQQVAELGAIPRQSFMEDFLVASLDVVNSEGLYVQVNMREAEDCKNTSTNPNSDFRVSSINITRLLATYCATIDDALAYLKGLNIYDANNGVNEWSMAYGIMDKTGRYGVIEIVNNQVIWNEGREGFACGQGNFYWAKEAANVRFGAGLGRWRKLMEYYYDIESQKDMDEAMKRIRYTNFITDGSLARDWKVDWLSEFNDKIPYFMKSRLDLMYKWRDTYGITIDEKHLAKALKLVEKEKQQGGPVWSFEFLGNPENTYDVITFIDLFIKCFAQLPLDAQKASGLMECSTIGYTANSRELGYVCRFFEMEDVFHIGMNETKIDKAPMEKKLGNA